MGRSIFTGTLIRAQSDFFSAPNVRASGILSTGLTSSLFFNNAPLSWSLLDGTSVPDSSISSGHIYFNEITGSPGFYSVRFYPDRVGYWRLVLEDIALTQENILEFDIIPAAAIPSGLIASFEK